MRASDSLKASHVHNLFLVGKSNPLTGRWYGSKMRDWDDNPDEPTPLSMKLEFALLFAMQIYAIYAMIEMVLS